MNDNNNSPTLLRSRSGWGVTQQATMNAKTFFDKVSAMRKAQKEYLKTRSQSALRTSRMLETEIDREIERVTEILDERQPKQQELFKND